MKGRTALNGSRRKLATVAEEAERLGISKSWLYTEIRAGRFPCIVLGSRRLLDPEEVDRFLDERRVTFEDALREAGDHDRGW